MRVIKSNRIIEDSWQRLQSIEPDQPLPEGNIIVPFDYWKQNKKQLLDRDGELGVCLNGDNNVEEISEDLADFSLIALEFPQFKDGRCYSHARLLRERYKFPGELRAVGDVLRDQIFFMHRCGIDSFHIREDKDIEDALKAFSEFSVTYQTAADGVPPIYKRR